jgi:polynucleotide 5'-kinase involved in rRNA processing
VYFIINLRKINLFYIIFFFFFLKANWICLYYQTSIFEKINDRRIFNVPWKEYNFFFVVLLLFFIRRDNRLNYSRCRPMYRRDCYYRLICEILLCSGRFKDSRKTLVVTGNPGVGKTTLSYLFIRALLELGVSVCFIFISFFVL